jgi:hypothetical protein
MDLAKQLWSEFLLRRLPVLATFAREVDSPHVTVWSYDRRRQGGAVRIEFQSRDQMHRFSRRWPVLVRAILACSREDAGFGFDRVKIHLGDGVMPGDPADIVAFARRPGSAARLIPNVYLLGPRPTTPPPRPWDRKSDSLYFRGASTGSPDYDANARVALCRVARSIPRSDCRISKLRQIDRDFVRNLAADDIVARADPLARLNDHRYLADVDGNTSSWDRYLMIGTFGGVPIRFEPAWEECWHDALVDGENCVRADRETLPGIIERLRADEAEGRAIAIHAMKTVRTVLAPAALRDRLRRVLGAGWRTEGHPGP